MFGKLSVCPDGASNADAAPWKKRWRAWWNQTAALFHKNYLLATRNVRATTIQLAVPFIFCLLLLLLQIANDNNPRRAARTAVVLRPEDMPVGLIPRCYVPPEQTEDRACITFAYTQLRLAACTEVPPGSGCGQGAG